jgi:uncharacterized protein (DUF488 family)
VSSEKKIWTIGHSTHPIEEFVKMLQSFHIELLVDIRRYPGSKFCPQFNEDALEESLAENAIEYIHMPELGGRRSPKKDSKNKVWRNTSFRGYADYMETDEFKKAIEALEERASKKPTVYMCSEAYYLKCHRSMVSDYLKSRGWTVMHITGVDKATEHKYTQPSHIEKGELTYHE